MGDRSVRLGLPLSLATRVPLTSIGLLLVLECRALRLSYAVAGLAAGALALGMTAGAPLIARWCDRRGQTAPLLACAALAPLALVGLTLLPRAAPAELVLLSLAAGALYPPTSICARAMWAARLERARLARILSLEASLQEVCFAFGPVAFVLIATRASPDVALWCAAAVVAATTVVFAAALAGEAPERVAGGGDAHRWLGPMRGAGIRMLCWIVTAMGASFGMLQIGVIASATAAGAAGLVGVMFAVWCAGSFLGGLAYARRGHHAPGSAVVNRLLLPLAASTALLAATPAVWSMAAGLFVAGIWIAPLVALTNGLVNELAPGEMQTEAYAWLGTAVTGGAALGAAAAGAVTSAAGPRPAFLAGAALLVLAAVGVRVRGERLEPVA